MNGTTTIHISEKNLVESELNEADVTEGLLFDRTYAGRLKNDQLNLLVKIDKLGSIVRAAKAIGISYKIAWDTIIAISNDFGKPLVYRLNIGKGEGVTRLTNEGKKIITLLTAETKEGDNFESQCT